MTIEQALRQGAARLASESPELDAQLLLGAATGRSRSSLYAWSDKCLTAAEATEYERLLARRQAGEPVAYLVGRREFWSLPLAVSPATLIPRPDTECLVEQALELALPTQAEVLDLGTGTGAIALALASERPQWQIMGADQSAAAVDLARHNAGELGFERVQFLVSDWFASLQQRSHDLIVSNPPYISGQDPHLSRGDVRYEPSTALVAGEGGLAALKHIVEQAPKWLKPGGWLILEHGYDQAEAVAGLFTAAGFTGISLRRDYGGQPRVSQGQWPTPEECEMADEINTKETVTRATMDDQALERYSRQLLMPAFDVAGQERLLKSRILVVGAGGLGCPVVLYLAAAGVGEIRVFDPDHVELANLQRQIAFSMADLGRNKAEALCERAAGINPAVKLTPHATALDETNLPSQVSAVDLVIDASDNFTTRFQVNNACVAARTPLLSGAAIRAEGQVAFFHPAGQAGGCYRCLYADVGEQSLTCSEAGVLGPLVGMVGTVQAMEAVKWLSGVGQPLAGRLLILDAMAMQWREMRLQADPECPVCSDLTAP